MILTASIYGNGRLMPTDALLHIIAPAGSLVTITKGSATETGLGHVNINDPTLYDYYFIIHQSQFDSITPWTVTATIWGVTSTESVLIDSSKAYDVIMPVPNLYLYNSGTYTSAYSSSNVITNGSVTEESTYISIFSVTGSQKFAIYKRWENVDLTHYTTITLNITGKAPTDGDFESRIFCTKNSSLTYGGNAEAHNDYYAKASAKWVNFVVTLDVSALTGVWYVGVGTDSRNSAWQWQRQGQINSVLLSS